MQRIMRTRRMVLVAVLGAALLSVGGLVLTGSGSAKVVARHTQLTRVTHADSNVLPVISCGQLSSMDFSNVPDAPTQITSASAATINGASYCEVQGYISPQVQFDLRLPTATWNGDYVQEGCGGNCGSVQTGPPAVSSGCPAVTGNQLAIATDNEGHVGSSAVDGLWSADAPALRVSYAYTSEHALDQASKAIIAAFYGRQPLYSYYDGCSTGGREALVEAQRYPTDFNGILAGAPVNILTYLNAELHVWNVEANTAADGKEILTAEKLPALHNAVMKACAGPSGFITDPRSCDFNPASIECPPGQDDNSCLTSAQVTVVEKEYRGPVDSQGQSLYPGGMPYGSELAWQGLLADPASDPNFPADTVAYQFAIQWLKYQAYPENPPASFTLNDFHFNLQDYASLGSLAGLYDATDPSLSAFERHGGKIILYQGWADQDVSPFGTVQYYSAVVKAAGGFAASQSFSRLYMIPGQYHCLAGGAPSGVTADLLTPLIDWVQTGTAPQSITFPLVQPTATASALTVAPLNPDAPPPGGFAGLNAHYNWVGSFKSGTELWCNIDGMDVACKQGSAPPSS